MTVYIKLNICVEVVNKMDKSREQFNHYMKTRFPNVDGFTRYVSDMVWQASRESLEVELPLKADDKDPFYDDFDAGLNIGIEKCKELLISNGVKIKNGTL